MKNKKKLIGAIIAIVVVLAILAGVYAMFAPKATKGSKAYTVEVVTKDGSSKNYSARTDAEFLRGALEELQANTDFTIEGDESEYGLYITAINGEVADYAADGAYWSIYVNDDYGMYGVDSQPVTDGDAYKLVYEVYVAE